jgi:hypothetical protein
MKDKLDKIFSESECISEETMYAYLEDKLTPKQRHSVDIHLASCELCSDAFEGLSLIQDKDKIRGIVAEINSNITGKTVTEIKKPFFIKYRLSIAAAVAFFIIAGSIFIIFNNSNKEKEDKLFAEKFEPFKDKSNKQIVDSLSLKSKDNEETIPQKEKLLEEMNDRSVRNAKIQDKSAEDIPASPKNSPAKNNINNNPKMDIANKEKLNSIPKAVIVGGNPQQWSSQSLDKDQSTININAQSIAATPSAQSNADIQSITYKNADVAKKSEKKSKQYSNAMKAAPANIPNDTTKNDVVLSNERSKSRAANPSNVAAPAMSPVQGASSSSMSYSAAEEFKINPANSNPLMDSAMKKYDAKDFSNASVLFNKILANNKSNYNALFYSSVCYLSLDRADSAVINLDKVLKIKNGEFYQDAQWYKALALIRQDKKKAAKKLLNEIIANGGIYKAKAEQTYIELDK